MRKHRVQVNDLGRWQLPVAHGGNRIAVQQLHALGDLSHFTTSGPGSLQAVFQQRRYHWLALQQRHFAAQRGDHKGVASQTCGGIQHAGPDATANTHRPRDHLPRPAAKLATMRQRAANKVHPDRTRCAGFSAAQGQPGRTQLKQQRHISCRFGQHRQLQAFGQRLGAGLPLRVGPGDGQ